eukprot:scaffold110008_cov60-Phaeocystis_antarctica.AAC.1
MKSSSGSACVRSAAHLDRMRSENSSSGAPGGGGGGVGGARAAALGGGGVEPVECRRGRGGRRRVPRGAQGLGHEQRLVRPSRCQRGQPVLRRVAGVDRLLQRVEPRCEHRQRDDQPAERGGQHDLGDTTHPGRAARHRRVANAALVE